MSTTTHAPIAALEPWLQLRSVPALKFSELVTLLRRFGESSEHLIRANSQDLLRAGLSEVQISALKTPQAGKIESISNWLSKCENHRVLTLQDDDYPELLLQLSSPPLLLYCCGDVNCINKYQLAIVGSRKASAQGKKITADFAGKLAMSGWVITSGMAMGIDRYAHQGALQNNGQTVAVLGTGVNRIYPQRNQDIYDSIVEGGGCVISEFDLNTPPKPFHFPRRNRLISGLSQGVLVIEADVKSGSLVTTKYALEQNREIFAIPGSIYNPLSKGCHQLIKQGAKLVEQVSDINEEFAEFPLEAENLDTKNPEKNLKQGLATDQLLASVGYEATPLDVVVQRSGLPVKVVLAKLLEYELRGLLVAVPGGYSRLGE
ncbi:MAG: DNA-protecting protein DprA [Alteromonadaceae bacterium]|nr:DNA-protecting protein DprA [Alteromonadaceae bacterium]